MRYTNRLSMDYRRLVSKLMPSWKREAEVKKIGKRYIGPTSDVNSVFGNFD